MKGIVNSQDGLRLRLSPSIGAEILGTMIYKTPVEVISNVNGWYEIAAIANGVIFNQTFWANSKYITIQKPLSYTLGIHFINNHEDARSMLSRGLKAALVMNGKTSAQKLAQDFPKATIVYRRDYQGQSAQQFFNDLEVSVDDPPNLFYVGQNEGSTDSDKTIRDRFTFDLSLANLINARRKTMGSYLAFSGGHGNPAQIETDWMQKLMRDTYSSPYNDGVFAFDCHNYTCGTYPRAGTYVLDTKWYETRTNWLFEKCGFNPLVKNIWHTESGIEGGCSDRNTHPGVPGGFFANNYASEEFRVWYKREKEIHSQKIMVNGINYDSPDKFGFVYQRGDKEQWGGYYLNDSLLSVVLEEQ